MNESNKNAWLYGVIVVLVLIVGIFAGMLFGSGAKKIMNDDEKKSEVVVPEEKKEDKKEGKEEEVKKERKEGERYIEITSPAKDGMTFNATPIVFEGKVSEGAVKIQVIAEGEENEHVYGYTDDYTLENFKKGDRDFTYRVNTGFENLKAGKNNYEFIAHFEDGKTEKTEIGLNFIFDGEGVIAFDGCGNPTKYKGEKWYGDLKENFNKLGLKSYNMPIYFDVMNDAIGGYGVDELCYSADTGVVLLISSGEYCEFGNIYRYSIESGELAEATYAPEKTCATAFEFLKRDGNNVPIKAGFGDAGCGGDYYYDYDFLLNKITLNKAFMQCVGEPGSWTYYK